MISTLLWFGLIALVFFMMMRGGCGSHVMGHGHRDRTADRRPALPPANQPPATPQTATDPVCGMAVPTATAKTSVFDGSVYYFCSAQHRDVFEGNPGAYVTKTQPASGQEKAHRHGC